MLYCIHAFYHCRPKLIIVFLICLIRVCHCHRVISAKVWSQIVRKLQLDVGYAAYQQNYCTKKDIIHNCVRTQNSRTLTVTDISEAYFSIMHLQLHVLPAMLQQAYRYPDYCRELNFLQIEWQAVQFQAPLWKQKLQCLRRSRF